MKLASKKGGGFFNVVLIVGLLFMVMIVGLLLAFGGMAVKWTVDTISPELSSLGMAGDSNLSQVADYTVKPATTFVDSFSWLFGVIYVFAIIMMFGMAFAFKVTGNKWLMVVFFACMFLVVIGSIFISNIYQDFYEDSGDVGNELRAMTLLSFMLLNSPVIMSVVGFVSGIIMFSGLGGEEEQSGY